MNKFIISLFAVLFLGLFLVSATDLTNLVINPTSVSIVGMPGDSKSATVQFTNNVGSSLNLNIVKVDLVGLANPDKRILLNQITISPQTFTLPDTQSQNVLISLTIPTGLPADTYKGTFTITDGVNNKNFDVLVTISAQPNFNIQTYSESNPLTLDGQADSTINGTFSIQNTGSATLVFDSATSYDISGLDLSDNTRTMGLTFPSSVSINSGEIKNIALNINVPKNMKANSYGGLLKVQSNGVQKQFKLDIEIHPQLCKNGAVGEFTIDIVNPDSGKEFTPGSPMDIRVNVANSFDKDISGILVHAFLYDIDKNKKIVEGDSDTQDINSNSDKDFKFTLDIPEDRSVKAGDQYLLFVKGFEEGSESKHCAEGQVDVGIKRNTHDVLVKDVTVSPIQTIKQGESFDVSARAINVGSNTENNVKMRISIPELKIDVTSSDVFNLNDGESNSNDHIVYFRDLKVPTDAKVKKDYSVEVTTVLEGGKTNTGFGKLDVIEGENQPPVIPPVDILRIQSSSETSVPGTFTVGAIVTNGGSASTTYTIEGSASWANPVSPQLVVLNSGESKAVQFTFVGREGLSAGSYSGDLIVKDNKGVIVGSQSFTVAAAGKPSTPSVTGFTIFQGISGSTVLFIIGDIVLVIIAIFFIRLIFTSGRRRGNLPPPKVEKVKL